MQGVSPEEHGLTVGGVDGGSHKWGDQGADSRDDPGGCQVLLIPAAGHRTVAMVRGGASSTCPPARPSVARPCGRCLRFTARPPARGSPMRATPLSHCWGAPMRSRPAGPLLLPTLT